MEINREIIKLARQARGFSQKDLASMLQIKQGTYSKIENEFLSVDEALIEGLSNALQYPKEFFYQKKEVHLVKGHYRRKLSLPQKEVVKYQSIMTIVEWNIEKMMEALDLPAAELPRWDCIKDGEPDLCAQFLREFWKLPKGRIPNITNLIENKGVIVIPIDLGPIDAFSAFSDEGLPLIFVHRSLKGDRYRFNLAHELGHLIMHFGQKVAEDRDIEEEAHLFASEFLVPGAEIKPYLNNLSLEKLADLKRYWLVSMQSLIVKAYKHLGVLSKSQYHYLFKKMSIKGYRKNEPIFIPIEKPDLLPSMIRLHIDELEYSDNELAEMLNLRQEEFKKYYLNLKTELKIA
ncbi:XRE family transcriptional regulator [Salinimicrobium sp. 3283s]|uniref:XRE family transcriptional regulator n=1 Tax=Salinimicrobium sp. 3283s TaxID=3114359 RepID=UPI0031E7BFD2